MHPEFLTVIEEGKESLAPKVRPIVVKPKKDGKEWDQTGDAANNMRYAATLDLPKLPLSPPVPGCAIVVGGGPSIEDLLPEIKALVADPANRLFALNWAHTWLINQGVVPHGCVMFEIDVDPCQILESSHPDVTYYICSHCHPATFDGLAGRNRVLWHSPPNSPAEQVVFDEISPDELRIGGGISTFLRTLSLALALGYRSFDLFGIDSSFPDDASSTHVSGYPTIVSAIDDAIYIYARDELSGEVKRFKSVSYLAYQVDEFKKYCAFNHQAFSMRVHGDTLLAFVHRNMYRHQYA